jgi:hypothetical protein
MMSLFTWLSEVSGVIKAVLQNSTIARLYSMQVSFDIQEAIQPDTKCSHSTVQASVTVNVRLYRQTCCDFLQLLRQPVKQHFWVS